jgi:hypothetical protein
MRYGRYELSGGSLRPNSPTLGLIYGASAAELTQRDETTIAVGAVTSGLAAVEMAP